MTRIWTGTKDELLQQVEFLTTETTGLELMYSRRTDIEIAIILGVLYNPKTHIRETALEFKDSIILEEEEME